MSEDHLQLLLQMCYCKVDCDYQIYLELLRMTGMAFAGAQTVLVQHPQDRYIIDAFVEAGRNIKP